MITHPASKAEKKPTEASVAALLSFCFPSSFEMLFPEPCPKKKPTA